MRRACAPRSRSGSSAHRRRTRRRTGSKGDGGTYDPQEEIRRREERLAKMARVREALRKEVAEARAVRLREQAEELRKKAEDMTRTPAKRAEAATLAKKRDQQASLFDDDDLDPPPPLSLIHISEP